MTKDKPKKRKTGNCYAGRCHTCKGFGIRKGGSGRTTIYLCSCQCHEDKREEIAEFARKCESVQEGLRRL